MDITNLIMSRFSSDVASDGYVSLSLANPLASASMYNLRILSPPLSPPIAPTISPIPPATSSASWSGCHLESHMARTIPTLLPIRPQKKE
jgi:hypothetical protein